MLFINRLLQGSYRLLRKLTDVLGRVLSYLLLLMMLVTGLVVFLRYGLQYGNIIFLQELISYLHSATFLLAIAWGLRQDIHVRVDIFYRNMSPRSKAWVNAVGGLVFLLPLSLFLMFVSIDFVMQSWSIKEVSGDAGGIPFVYGLKTFIPLSFALLAIEGVLHVICNGLSLCLDKPFDENQKGDHKNNKPIEVNTL